MKHWVQDKLGWEEKFGLARSVEELESTLADLYNRGEIPDEVFAQCKAVMFVILYKTGLGLISQDIGYGCLVARLPPERSKPGVRTWSPPISIKVLGISAGLTLGFRKTHALVLLNSDRPAQGLMLGHRFTLGAELSFANGSLAKSETRGPRNSRNLHMVSSYVYNQSGGMYIGVGLQGAALLNRPEENHIFYEDENVTPMNVLLGQIPVQKNVASLQMLLEALPAANEEFLHSTLSDSEPTDKQDATDRESAARERQRNRTSRYYENLAISEHQLQEKRDTARMLRRAPSSLLSFLRMNLFFRYVSILLICVIIAHSLPNIIAQMVYMTIHSHTANVKISEISPLE